LGIYVATYLRQRRIQRRSPADPTIRPSRGWVRNRAWVGLDAEGGSSSRRPRAASWGNSDGRQSMPPAGAPEEGNVPRGSTVAITVVSLLAAAGGVGVLLAPSAGAGQAGSGANAAPVPVCQHATTPGRMSCLALRAPRPAGAAATPRGYGPA